jgi:hypothetical protein
MLGKVLVVVIFSFLLFGCAGMPIQGPSLSDNNEKLGWIGTLADKLGDTIRADANGAIDFCNSVDAKSDPMSRLQCPVCAQATLILVDKAEAARGKAKTALQQLQLLGGDGLHVIKTATMFKYGAGKDPQAWFNDTYDELLSDAISWRNACATLLPEKEMVKLGISGAMSIR